MAHQQHKERAWARVKCFDLSGGRLTSLSFRKQNQARRPLLAAM